MVTSRGGLMNFGMNLGMGIRAYGEYARAWMYEFGFIQDIASYAHVQQPGQCMSKLVNYVGYNH